jgi:hypothetical protein
MTDLASTDLALAAGFAIVCLALMGFLLNLVVRSIARNEVRRCIDRLGNAKFVLQAREKNGQFKSVRRVPRKANDARSL